MVPLLQTSQALICLIQATAKLQSFSLDVSRRDQNWLTSSKLKSDRGASSQKCAGHDDSD